MGGTMCKIRGQGREDFEGEGAKNGKLQRTSTGRCRGRDSQRLRSVGEGHAPPGGAPAQETGYHEIRKRQRFVIARALCARGNLAVPGCIVGKLPAKSQLPSRDCHVASLLAMTRQAGAAVHQSFPAVSCPSARRSLTAATDAIGPCVLSTPCTNCKCLPEIATPLCSSQ